MKSINKNLITAMPLPAFLLVFLFLSISSSLAQPGPITKGENRLVAFGKYMEMKAGSPFAEMAWQFVGPGNISIRCTDVEVVRPKGQSYTMYAATASGGLWKTVNEGTTWEPLTEDLATASIGDIALDPSNPDILWMGTGEANIFRSSQSGAGIFRTTDGGKSWKHLGLENTFTIARILVHPENSQVVYVAASGHEWTPNPERGIYKTTNGGETWEKILFVNDMTGAIDLVMHPENPDILYAATWQRIRKKWNDPRNEPGYNGSGIWKTTDGGKNWEKVNNGLPEARYRGRIGIDIARSNPEVLYAFIDNYEIIREAYGETDSYGRPRGGVIMGATVYRTSNGARSWERVSGQTEEMARYMERHSGTYGWVFGQIRVDPNDENTIYTMGVQLHVSNDGGKTFRTLRGMHGDHHGLWIDPDNSDYLFNANDGGVCVSYDRGETWHLFTERLQASQFFNVQVDNADPFHVYGSIQDHGSYRAEVDLSRGRDRIAVADFEWAPGGEGSNHAIDPIDPNRVYAAGFYGNMIRGYLQENGWQTKTIVPRVYEDEPPLRGQWMAPFILSPHNPDIVYLGMQYLFRSIDRGNTWERISPDLTYNDPKKMGDIPYQTLFTISESPLMPGLIYAGTDDGRAHLTKDGGKTWTEITKGLVPHKWVSRVVASRYHMGTVYLTQNGKRDDDFAPYIWKSDDYGKTWKSIAANIPIGPVNVIREDPFNRDILYVGTDAGVFVSLDAGNHWDVLGDLPMTYVLDLVIQERENFIVIGTHGRGVWLMDANEINGGTRPRWRR
ncbi:MAG: WD40/YVTN/BNR-like repeat-containing protein [Bacteroidales bacterium]